MLGGLVHSVAPASIVTLEVGTSLELLQISLTDPPGEFIVGQLQLLQQWCAVAQICWYVAGELVAVKD